MSINSPKAREGSISTFDELAEALRNWAREAVSYLTENTQPVVGYDFPSWRRHDEDLIFYRSAPEETLWPIHSFDELKALPAWQRVEEVVAGNSRLSSQVNTPIGTAAGSTRLSIESLGMLTLPRPDEVDDVDAAFLRRYEALDWILSTNERAFVAFWPVPGLTSEHLPIQLESDLEIDRMTDQELGAALDAGAIRPLFLMENAFNVESGNPTCLRLRYTLSKIVGDERPEEEVIRFRRLQERLDAIQDGFEQTLALLYSKPAMVYGRVEIQTSPRLFGFNLSWREATLSREQLTRQVDLDEDAIAALQGAWRLLMKPGALSGRKGLAVALRRLRDQARRERVEDELVDIMIGAEALYLSGTGTAELGFRLALRASAWASPDELNMSRRDVFTLMLAAYKVRSSLVHGDEPKAKDLAVRGSQVQIAEFTLAVETVVRHGLRKAFNQATWPPDWDGLTLPSGQ